MPPISPFNSSGLADSTNVSKFTKVLPLSIRKDGLSAGAFGMSSPGSPSTASHQHQGEMKENVRITLTYPSSACGAMNPHKEIVLRLTNDENPMFFYHLRITDADFPELKSQQGLLVDFYGFPNQLVTLLDKCDVHYGSDEGNNSPGGGGSKFMLVMKLGSVNSVLDIVESNPFKYLCHLSLQINAGTDGDVKKYLCDVTTGLKKDYQLLRDKYNHLMSSMESENIRTKEKMEMKNEEINQLRDQLHAQANSLSTKHFQDMTGEKEKLLKLQSELASKFEHERNDLERRHAIALSNLEDRISSLEAENRELLQNKYKNETLLQDSSNKMKHCEDDLKLLQQEITLLRKQNDKLDKDYHEKQRISSNLHNRVTTLETDLREKQGILERNHEQILQLSEQKSNLEEHATAMVKEVERVKNVNKMISTELIKANEIIKKLQDDIRSLNTKTKLQAHVTSEQERVIMEKEKTIAELESKVATLQSSLDAAESEVEKLTTSGNDFQSKIESLEKTIKTNENMISWLNKQLNEFQGLSNLTKFRQNLANSANHLTSSAGHNPSPIPNPTATGTNINELPASALSRQLYENPAGVLGGLGSGRRFGGTAFPHGNYSHNTLPNGTPSWMHIYQSTSTPLDDDLSSRLEKVSTNPGLGMNYNDLKSRFADPFDKDSPKEKQPVKNNGEIVEESKSKSAAAGNGSRPPIWARGKSARVTLEGVAPQKPGILRR